VASPQVVPADAQIFCQRNIDTALAKNIAKHTRNLDRQQKTKPHELSADAAHNTLLQKEYIKAVIPNTMANMRKTGTGTTKLKVGIVC